MPDPTTYPDVDPLARDFIKSMRNWPQVQYATSDQLRYLHDLAVKMGLYDAAEVLKKLAS